MNLELSGKVAVVTGASKGIGLAVTNALAREGVFVAAGARDISEELTTLAANSQVHPVSVDLTERDGPRDQLLRCCSHHTCRFAADARTRGGHNRHDLLSQPVSARSSRDGLQRCEGCAGKLLQSSVQRSRS